MDISAEILDKVRLYALKNEKAERYSHSVRVAQTSEFLCRRYGLDEKKGYFAGLAHDMCKDLDKEKIMALAEKDGMKIGELERKKPSLLHGRAAAVKLNEDFGVDDKEILEAVAFHTFGKDGICDLAKLVFVADKVEPERPQSTEEYRAKLFALDLNSLVLSVLEENIEYLKAKGKSIAFETFAFRDYLKKQIDGENKAV